MPMNEVRMRRRWWLVLAILVVAISSSILVIRLFSHRPTIDVDTSSIGSLSSLSSDDATRLLQWLKLSQSQPPSRMRFFLDVDEPNAVLDVRIDFNTSQPSSALLLQAWSPVTLADDIANIKHTIGLEIPDVYDSQLWGYSARPQDSTWICAAGSRGVMNIAVFTCSTPHDSFYVTSRIRTLADFDPGLLASLRRYPIEEPFPSLSWSPKLVPVGCINFRSGKDQEVDEKAIYGRADCWVSPAG